MNKPMIISGAGFFVCLISFLIAATLGKSSFTTSLFIVGFIIGSVGVLIGFFTFKQD